MKELKERGIIRSYNNPTGDVGEYLVADYIGLKLVSNSVKGYDALDDSGNRYQIKARRHAMGSKSRQMGSLRDLDEKLFDFLLAAILDEKYKIIELWKIPFETVIRHKKTTTRGFDRLMLQGELLSDSSVIRLI